MNVSSPFPLLLMRLKSASVAADATLGTISAFASDLNADAVEL
jgi:hypothetical protein